MTAPFKMTENQRNNKIAALKSFFKLKTTFNVRWKHSWRKDWIAPGVYEDEFLEDHTRKELKRLIAEGLIQKCSYTNRRTGVRRAAVILKCYEMPQVTKWKKFMARFDGVSIAAWLAVGAVFFATLALLVLAPWKKAHAFGASITQPALRADRMPPSSTGYFDDTEKHTRCYWMTSNYGNALSCVPDHK